MDDSVFFCDRILDVKKANFNEKSNVENTNFYILLAFLLITIILLIAVSIYCCLIKKQEKHVLPFHNANDKLNKFCIYSIN